MASVKKRKYTSNSNRYHRKKKNVSEKQKVKKEANVEQIDEIKDNEVKSVDLAIDKLLDEKVLLKDSTKMDEIEKEEVEAFIPEKNSLIETKPDESLEEEAKEEKEEKIFIPYIPEIKEDDEKLEKTSLDMSIPVIEDSSDTKEHEDLSNDNTDSNEKKYESDITYKENKNNKYLGYNERLLINVIGIVLFFIIGIMLVISSISIKTQNMVLYDQSSNVDYKVYLKPNDYYKEPYLDKNMQYIANLINDVDVNFSYNFSVNQSINYTYSYYVKADVAVTDSQDKTKVIYSKSDKLTEPVIYTKESSNGFNINQNIKVDYDKYNDLVKSFKSSYAISANSNLTLSLCVQIQDEKGNMIRSYASSDTMKLKIPLTEQMIDITMDSKSVNNDNNNASVYKDFSISNKVTFILSFVSFIISIAFVVKLLLFIRKTSAKKSLYDVTLSKILREYDRVIVNSKKIVDLNNEKEIIDVNSFTELLDVRDNLEKPIIFSEVHKGQKSVFIVKTSNETYRYVLKLADLEKETRK